MDQPTPASLTAKAPAPLGPGEIRSIILGILLAMLLAALDQTIVATAMPTIGRDLGDVEHLSWMVTAYLLTSTAVTPLYGKFSDSHGRRITLLIGIAAFLVGSVACALAPTMLTLILARGLQGLGGGGLISLAQTIIADLVSPRERARYQVYIASVFVSSSLAGPVLGGFLAQHLHWSAIFWINVPLGLVAFWMSNAALKRLPRHDRPQRLDVAGAVLLVSATVALMLALSWGGLRHPWLSAPILGLILASALLWSAFAVRLRTARDPLIPLAVLRNPVVRTATLSACFAMGTFIGLTIFVPIYLEAVVGLTASESGLALIPLMVGTVTGATISGRAMGRFTHYKRLPLMGLSLSVVATAILVAAERLPLLWLEVLFAATSIGLGTVLPVATVSIQNAVVPHQLGTATAVANFFRQLGGALIVAVFGAIVLGASGGGGAGMTLETLGSAARGGAGLADVFRLVFAAALAGFVLALVFLIAMEERPLRDNRAAPRAPDEGGSGRPPSR